MRALPSMHIVHTDPTSRRSAFLPIEPMETQAQLQDIRISTAHVRSTTWQPNTRLKLLITWIPS